MTDSFANIGDIFLKLLVATVLGGLIGLEREAHDRPAGLRTHTLVCLGSAIYMILSMSFSKDGTADPGRIAAQVATGVGFLGAGTIIRHGNSVRGLTTAASIWAVAAIGLCVGRGDTGYIIAISATAFVFGTLRGLSYVEKRLALRLRVRHTTIRYRGGDETFARIGSELTLLGVQIQAREAISESGDIQTVLLSVILPSSTSVGEINARLSTVSGVQSVTWD